MSFDYRREMMEAVSEAPKAPPERLAWIMTEEHQARFYRFQIDEMGAEPDMSQCFGIPIETGQPTNGAPFELILKPPR